MPSSFKQHLSSLRLDAGIQEAVIFAMIGRRRHEGNPRVCEMKFLMISLSNSRKMSCSTWILFISKHKYLKMCHNEGLKSFFPLANKTVVADGVRFYFSYIYWRLVIQPVSFRSAISNELKKANTGCFTFTLPGDMDCFSFVGAMVSPAKLIWEHISGKEVHKVH